MRGAPSSTRGWSGGVGLTLVLAVVSGEGGASAWAGASPTVAQPAPDFERPTLDGRAVKSADWRGRVVLVNFWASWCAPCLIEMPQFSDWQQRHAGRGFQVVGISMDDSAAPVRRLLAQRPVTYPVVMGDTALAKLYGGIYGLPSTFLIDRKGIIRARFRGEVDLKELEAQIQTLLAEPARGG